MLLAFLFPSISFRLVHGLFILVAGGDFVLRVSAIGLQLETPKKESSKNDAKQSDAR